MQYAHDNECICDNCYMTGIISTHERLKRKYGYVLGQPIKTSWICIVCGGSGQLMNYVFERFVKDPTLTLWKHCHKGFCNNCYSENALHKTMKSLRRKQIQLIEFKKHSTLDTLPPDITGDIIFSFL